MTKKIIKTKVVKDNEWSEYIVRAWTVDGRYPAGDYFTGGIDREHQEDAQATAKAMKETR